MKVKYRRTELALAVSASVLSLGLAAPVQAVEFGSKDGWSASMDGSINAFVVSTKADRLNGADASGS